MSMLRLAPPSDSIRLRLFRLISAVAVMVLLISMSGAAFLEWGDQQRQVQESLSAIAQSVGAASSAALAFNDAKAAEDILRLMVSLRDIEGAALYDVHGNRMAVYGDMRRLPEHATALTEHQPVFSVLSTSTTLFQPVWVDDSMLGHIYVRASLASVHKSFLLLALLSVGVNLIGLLMALWLASRYLGSILTPVNALADVARRVRADKDFSRRVPEHERPRAKDEIGELIDSFNAMLGEIERRDQKLFDYQKSLEMKVNERTLELQSANQELRSAKETAELANLSKSLFLAAASHDLRQPIQAVGLFARALGHTPLSPEQDRISTLLNRSVSSLGDLLNTLLDVSQLDTGGVVADPQSVEVADLFGEIEMSFSVLAKDKGLRFKLYYPEAAPELCTDKKLLLRLLRNLVGNAIKYTRQGGILVALRLRGERALLQVWDSGIGIAPQDAGRLFDEYFQVDNAERDVTKGLGLGLSIAQRLATLLETRITCRSRPGRGSVFELSLPLAEWVKTHSTA